MLARYVCPRLYDSDSTVCHVKGLDVKRRIASQALERFKKRVRKLTNRNRRMRMEKVVEKLFPYLNEWGECTFVSARPRLYFKIRTHALVGAGSVSTDVAANAIVV